MRRDEPGVSHDQIKIPGPLDPFESALAKLLHHALLSFADFAHVNGDIAMMYAIVGRATREIGYAGAIEHRLGRRAPIIDAGAADKRTLDERGLPTGVRECFRKRRTSLA